MAEVPSVPSLPPQESGALRLPGFDGLYGLEITHVSAEEAHARVVVRDDLLQPAGLVHGGVLAAMAESLCSTATRHGVAEDGHVARAVSIQTSFLRPIHDGTIRAVARRRHRGRTTVVWEVDVVDDADRLCALVRVTLAVRDAA